MTNRKVVMISSTARDLPDHREQVRLVYERAGFEPREMMEHLPALNTDAVAISLRMLDEADMYLGVFAYRSHWSLEKAQAHLTALHSPEPQMPAWDYSWYHLNRARLAKMVIERKSLSGR